MQGQILEQDAASTPRRIGQACDRCRKKKIKCNGTFPTCRSCEKARKVCEVSASLRRNTKVRGFASDDQQLEQLRAELTQVQSLLKLEQEKNAVMQQQLSQKPFVSIEQPLPPHQADDTAFVIKHMGRMVHDENGIGRFAGSITGVHFVLSVEQECQMPGSFAESCFRLFLAQSSPTQPATTPSALISDLEEIRACFSSSPAFYCKQAQHFVANWEAFCPIFAEKQLVADIENLFGGLKKARSFENINHTTVMTLLLILTINKLYSDDSESSDGENTASTLYLSLANKMTERVTARGDLKSIQALVLLALYNQLTANCVAMMTVNGMMVRLAQSIGLHRHARRFKMKLGEIEYRKRLWWWIYAYDKITSILHGLPPLIKDTDVDNDLPLDCHLYDFEANEISHPFPGERTPVYIFIQYVGLSKRLSRTLNRLYTTTQRRNGATKITELDRDLRVWNQNLKENGIDFDIGLRQTKSSLNNVNPLHPRPLIWLQLMANFAMLLIHRPGLSFDNTTTEFEDCLHACLDSSSAIIHLLETATFPKWLANLCLMGPGIIFQSALMHILCHCRYRTSKPDRFPELETSMAMVSKSISILEKGIQSPKICLSAPDPYCDSINQVIGTLQMLQSYVSQHVRRSTTITNVISAPDVGSDVLDNFDDTNWGGNALGALNYMTSTDWASETEGPFMGFMELES